MALLTLFPDDQPEAEWTTRDEADITGWLGRIGVVYEHIDYVPGGFDSAPMAADAEHTHAHAQCYLFREGAGALYLRAGGRVYLLLCTPGDLVIVPAGMRHWLDRGEGAAGAVVSVFGSDGDGSSAVTDAGIVGRFPSVDAYRPALGSGRLPALNRSRPPGRLPPVASRAAAAASAPPQTPSASSA